MHFTQATPELINNPGGTGMNELDPQRSVSYEVGLRALNERFAVELSAYHTRVRDALRQLEPDLVPFDPGRGGAQD